MKKSTWILLALAALGAGFAVAQDTSEPLVKHSFKDSDNGWIGIGQTAKVSVAHEPTIAPPDRGALKFEYGVGKGEFNILALPTPVGSLAKAKSVRFRMRSDSASLMVVVLQEQDGGRYTAMFTAPKDEWQTVELAPADFALSQEKDDPKDPDGKLDLHQVNAISIGDADQLFVQIDNPMIEGLFNIRKGGHSLYLQSFEVGTQPVSPSWSSSADYVDLETFAHPQSAWLGLGGMKVSRSIGKPLQGNSVRADYHQATGKLVLATHGVIPGSLANTQSLSFDVASIRSATIVVQVEETDGGKYKTTVDLPPGSEVKHVMIPFADFKEGDDSSDANGKLDPEKIKTFLVIDATGLTGQADGDNSLWLNHLHANRR